MQTFQRGATALTYCDEAVVIPSAALASMHTFIDAWCRVFPAEATYVHRTYGVPALTLRFDGVIGSDGSFIPYELQPAGAGIGYAGIVNHAFRAIRDRFVRGVWPPFKLVQNIKLDLDDEMWLERISLEEAVQCTDLLQLRHPLDSLDPETARTIIARSVKPVRFTISKAYGEALGWWRKVTYDAGSAESLPWETGFALKPIWGWGSYDIMIAHPQGRPGGSATRSQILRTFSKQKDMYLQPFIPPMQTELNGKRYNMILRPYFGFDPSTKSWVPWGGTWNARPVPALRIHGASDGIAGPLVLEA